MCHFKEGTDTKHLQASPTEEDINILRKDLSGKKGTSCTSLPAISLFPCDSAATWNPPTAQNLTASNAGQYQMHFIPLNTSGSSWSVKEHVRWDNKLSYFTCLLF